MVYVLFMVGNKKVWR